LRVWGAAWATYLTACTLAFGLHVTGRKWDAPFVWRGAVFSFAVALALAAVAGRQRLLTAPSSAGRRRMLGCVWTFVLATTSCGVAAAATGARFTAIAILVSAGALLATAPPKILAEVDR
jgi:hypothetical protein